MTTAVTQKVTPLADEERTSTRRAHRALFALMGLLPHPLASAVREAYFNSRFRDGSPWPYDTCSYELAKRAALVAEVQPDARVILEVGSADGHTLGYLADRARAATVIGIDVSPQACTLAIRRNQGRRRVTVETADLPQIAARYSWLDASVDTLILSEVLYYLGGSRATARQLAPIERLLAPHGRVILVHGSPDGRQLHDRAQQILGLDVVHEHRGWAAGRRYLVTVLHRRQGK